MKMCKRVYHIGENVSYESGGLRSMIHNLNNYVNSHDIPSEILTLKKEKSDIERNIPYISNPWYYSKSFKEILNNLDSNNSIFHLHGVFFYPQYIANKIAYKKNIPDILTSHGMLSDFLMNQKSFKKSIYKKLVLKNLMQKTQILHAITEYEKDILFKISGNKNIIEIPNLIDVNRNYVESLNYDPEDEYILYLGRFHNVKGIDLLVKAFESCNPKSLKLYLVGFKNEYSKSIEDYLISKKLTSKIIVKDALIDDEKEMIIKNAKALIYPSNSEVIGMVNLEAAALKTPVVTTVNTGIKKEWSENGGLLLQPNISELINAINLINQWTLEERLMKGNQIFDFVEKNYSWQKKGELWSNLYNTL